MTLSENLFEARASLRWPRIWSRGTTGGCCLFGSATYALAQVCCASFSSLSIANDRFCVFLSLRLKEAGDFDPRYLHLKTTAAAA